MIKKFLFGLVILSLLSINIVANPAANITEKCSLYLQADNFDALLTEISKYAKQFGMPLQKEQIKNMLSMKLLGKVGFPGVDLNRKTALFFYFDQKNMRTSVPGGVIMIPLSDRSAFRMNINPKLKRSPKIVVSYRHGYAVIASDQKAMREFRYGRKKRVKLINNAQLNLYLNMKSFNKIILGSIRNLSYLMASKTRKYGNNQGQSLINIFTTFYKDILMQINSQNVALNLDNRGLELGINFNLKNGSDISRLLKDLGSGRINTLGMMPSDCIMVSAGKVNWKEYASFCNKYLKLLPQSYKKMTDIFREILKTAGENYADEFSYALVPSKNTKGINFVTAAKVNSKNKSIRTLKKIIFKLNNLNVFKEARRNGFKVKFKFSENISSYKGNSIHGVDVKMETPNVNKSNIDGLIGLFKSIMKIRFSYINGYEVLAFGNESLRRIKQLIDISSGMEQGFKSSKAYIRIRDTYGQYQKNSIFYISLLGVANEIIKFSEGFSNKLSHIGRILKSTISTSGGIFGCGYSNNNNIIMRMMISKSEIFSLYRVIVLSSMQKMRPKSPMNKMR